MVKQDYRRQNPRCLFCSSPRPADTLTKRRQDLTEYVCPKCGSILVRELGGSAAVNAPSGTHIPQYFDQYIPILPPGSGARVELFWTNVAHSVAVSGRHVFGNENVTKFAKHLQSI